MYMSASAPEAPPFNETTIGCFMRLFFWMAAWIIRAIWSEAPPAPAATTISTGLVGSHAAPAAPFASTRPASAPAIRPQSFLITLLLLCVDPRSSGGSPRRRRPDALGKVVHRRRAAAGLHRHAPEPEAHLPPRQRAHQGEVVEVAKVPDAKYLARELAQTRAERHVKGLEDRLAHAIGVVSRRHQHRGERAGIFTR